MAGTCSAAATGALLDESSADVEAYDLLVISSVLGVSCPGAAVVGSTTGVVSVCISGNCERGELGEVGEFGDSSGATGAEVSAAEGVVVLIGFEVLEAGFLPAVP